MDRVRALLPGRPDPIVLIDGPSGAGKSTFADELAAHWPGAGEPLLVRMDGMYPGWGGLELAAAALAEELLGPLRRGEPGTWREWDWARDEVAAVHTVTPGRPLIVEGCGTLGPAARFADVAVWIDAEDDFRKARALARDGETYAVQWDGWQAAFERYVSRWDPRAHAHLLLRAEHERVVAAEGTD
ncbi:ATP-binding protein [Mycetocola tolaasinivorans]|uniref:ATP-binding protein n=1 Tax=Mycetocola tolaasinivorans TaxID=76635 RepID=A0A3L7A692_9MICO|nr:ATP-binding protein [Mycetocola tolaasinivorans]